MNENAYIARIYDRVTNKVFRIHEHPEAWARRHQVNERHLLNGTHERYRVWK